MSLSPEKRLDRLYSKMPSLDCKGRCHRSCGPIIASSLEVERMEKASGRPLGVLQDGLGCSLLDDDRRCTAYEVRPVICRLFGMVKAMACPFGCKPSRWIRDNEAKGYIRDATRHGGRPISSLERMAGK